MIYLCCSRDKIIDFLNAGDSFSILPILTFAIANTYSDKQVEIIDRASLMNVLLATDCYTIGAGIMPSLLNEERIVSVPFESDDFYTIGYILHTDRNISDLTRIFIEMPNVTVGDFLQSRQEYPSHFWWSYYLKTAFLAVFYLV